MAQVIPHANQPEDGSALPPPMNNAQLRSSHQTTFTELSMRHGALFLISIPSLAAGQSTDLGATADRVFAPWTRETPGCAVGVAQGGRTLLTRGYGM
jgi:hypothetical protein